MNGNSFTALIPLVLLIVVMYFMLIRPQKKREREVNAMRSSIRVGDEVITIGGICGKIVKAKDNDEVLTIQVGADKTKFEVMRWAISKVVSEAPAQKPARTARPKAEAEGDAEAAAEESKQALPRRLKRRPEESETLGAAEGIETADVAPEAAAEESASGFSKKQKKTAEQEAGIEE